MWPLASALAPSNFVSQESLFFPVAGPWWHPLWSILIDVLNFKFGVLRVEVLLPFLVELPWGPYAVLLYFLCSDQFYILPLPNPKKMTCYSIDISKSKIVPLQLRKYSLFYKRKKPSTSLYASDIQLNCGKCLNTSIFRVLGSTKRATWPNMTDDS